MELDVEISRYNFNNVSYPEFYKPYINVLSNIKTIEERLAAEWALTVLTPVKNKNNDIKWVTLAYEDLVINPEKALNKIRYRYNLNWTNENIFSILDKESFTKSSFQEKNKNKLSSWQKHLTSKQINLILNIVHEMGVDFYTEHFEPDYSAIYKEE